MALGLGLCAFSVNAQERTNDTDAAAVTLPDGAVITLSGEEREALSRMQSLDASLRYLAGEAQLGNGLATLTMPRGFRFLDAEQSARVRSAWGARALPGMLGMVFPPEGSPFEANVWSVALTFIRHGHIDDAEGVDESAVLGALRAYPTANDISVRWVDRPRYDRARRGLSWSRSLGRVDASGRRVFFANRVLTREGVIEMNAMTTEESASVVREAMEGLLRGLRVHEGQRYEDFRAETDRRAGYGLNALVAERAWGHRATVTRGQSFRRKSTRGLMTLVVVVIAGLLGGVLIGRRLKR